MSKTTTAETIQEYQEEKMNRKENGGLIIMVKPGLDNVKRSKVSKSLKSMNAVKLGVAYHISGAKAPNLFEVSDLVDSIRDFQGAKAPDQGGNTDKLGANAPNLEPISGLERTNQLNTIIQQKNGTLLGAKVPMNENLLGNQEITIQHLEDENKQLVKDIQFCFSFFQRNAPFKSMTKNDVSIFEQIQERTNKQGVSKHE